MRAASMLVAAVAGLTAAACGAAGPGAPAPTATPTWQQWLEMEASRTECNDPSHTMMYWQEKKNPPYSVKFFCQPPIPAPVAKQETPATITRPTGTPTWQQWLGQRIAEGRCPISGSTIKYRNERTEPPYRADLFCVEPTPTPDAVATQVAATVAAITPTKRPRPTSTPWSPPPTPTMQQIAEWDPSTKLAWDSCWRNGGEFEIYDIRQRGDGGWSWMYRCNPPPEAERRQRLEGQSDEKLLQCGIGVGLVIFTGRLVERTELPRPAVRLSDSQLRGTG